MTPFHYYAVCDPTNYDGVRMANGSYGIEDLERQLSHKERADLILKHYTRLAGERTLAFCASIRHAGYMADFFTARRHTIARYGHVPPAHGVLRSLPAATRARPAQVSWQEPLRRDRFHRELQESALPTASPRWREPMGGPTDSIQTRAGV